MSISMLQQLITHTARGRTIRVDTIYHFTQGQKICDHDSYWVLVLKYSTLTNGFNNNLAIPFFTTASRQSNAVTCILSRFGLCDQLIVTDWVPHVY